MKAASTPTSPRKPRTKKRRLSLNKTGSHSPSEKKTKQPPSFNIRSLQAAINYSTETPKEQHLTNNGFVHFIDNAEENCETIVYNIDPDSQSSSLIKLDASSSANIFSDRTAPPPQALLHNTSDDEQQSVCPISIVSEPAREAPDTNEVVKEVPMEPYMPAAQPQQPSPNIEHKDTPTASVQNPVMASDKPHRKVIILDPPNGEDNTQPQPTPSTILQKDPVASGTVQAVPNNEQDNSHPDQPHMEQLHTDQPLAASNTNEETAHSVPTVTTSIFLPVREIPSGTSSVYAPLTVSPNNDDIFEHGH